jgi:diguanylate cyclase (GGDEF)-like protein/PAS domain S-box-containing protein
MHLSPLVCTLVDASVDAAAVVDRNLEVLYFNSQYLRLAGLRRRELDGRRVRGMCHHHFGFEACNEQCVSARAFELGRTVRLDEVDSTRLPLRVIVTAVPLFEGDGEPYAVIEQYRDVTAEGRLQENYRALLEKERAQKDLLAKEVARQTAELERVNESLLAALNEVSRVARTDGLTGLANRRSFDEQLRAQLARAQRRESPLALVLLDLDHFKDVNDKFGHPVGDQLLKDFAHALTTSVREAHLVSRVGGEEFAVILPGLGLVEAELIAKRVQEQARSAGLLTTASAGVATFPLDGMTVNELMRAADWALYAAKRAGRNRVLCATHLRNEAGALPSEGVPREVAQETSEPKTGDGGDHAR